MLSDIGLMVQQNFSTFRFFDANAKDCLHTLISMALRVDSHGSSDSNHIALTSFLAEKIGRKLNLSTEDISVLSLGGLLHDIGKVAIPPTILLKPASLTREEWGVMQLHPIIGVRILEPYDKLCPVLPIVLHHHERWDGTGYPDKLSRTEIPLLARIITVIDAYTAMILGRVYRMGISSEEAVMELKHCSSTQFDGTVVEALGEIVKS